MYKLIKMDLFFLTCFSFVPTKMVYRYISELVPDVSDKWHINVMVSRCWSSYNPKTNSVFSFDMILSDERVR